MASWMRATMSCGAKRSARPAARWLPTATTTGRSTSAILRFGDPTSASLVGAETQRVRACPNREAVYCFYWERFWQLCGAGNSTREFHQLVDARHMPKNDPCDTRFLAH